MLRFLAFPQTLYYQHLQEKVLAKMVFRCYSASHDEQYAKQQRTPRRGTDSALVVWRATHTPGIYLPALLTNNDN